MLDSKELSKYLMSKRHENGMATLLQKLIQNDPNNLYDKNPRTLHKHLFHKS